MSDLKKKYNEIIKNLESNIDNKENLDYAKKQLNALANAFLDEMEKVEKTTEMKLERMDRKQKDIEQKMKYMESTLNEIERDIYDIDEDYDLEITCPYCDYIFALDEGSSSKNEIQCPECNNTIEIDWDGESFEEGCSGHCSLCGGECSEECGENEDDM